MKNLFLIPILLIVVFSCSTEEQPAQIDTSNKYIVFVAPDVSQAEKQGVERALEIASNEWDIDSFIEYWVIGEGIEEANILANTYCERRQELGQFLINLESSLPGNARAYRDEIDQDMFSQCLELMMFPNQSAESIIGANSNWSDLNYEGEFESYRGKGGAAVRSRKSWGGPGYDNYVRSSKAMVNSFTNSNIIGERSLSIVIHEYYHIFQAFYDNQSQDGYIVEQWFVEGGADFMASKLVYQRGLIESDSPDFKTKYRTLMTNIQDDIDLGYIISQESLDDFSFYKGYWTGSRIAYTFGAWATAYLNYKVGNNDSLNEYYSKLPIIGAENSFEDTYSLTLEEFYIEFNEFLKKPIDEQMEIIPDI